jgi:hypothetical protein
MTHSDRITAGFQRVGQLLKNRVEGYLDSGFTRIDSPIYLPTPTLLPSPPTYNAPSTGIKVLLYSQFSANDAGHAFGIANNEQWFGVPNDLNRFAWYTGITKRMSLSANKLELLNGVQLAPYQVSQSTLPSSSPLGSLLYCTNAFPDGKPDLIRGNGTEWIRMADEQPVNGDRIYEEVVQRNNLGTLVNTIAEANIFTYQIPANKLDINRVLKMEIWGDYLNSSGSNRTLSLRIAMGAITLFNHVTLNIPSNAARRPWRLVCEFGNLGTENSNWLSGLFIMGQAGPPTSGAGGLNSTALLTAPIASNGTTAINTSNNQQFNIFATHSVAATSVELRRFKSIAQIC